MTQTQPSVFQRDRLAEVRPGRPVDPRWREWYQCHASAIYGYIRFHLPWAQIAEDLTADTFLKAFRASARFDESRGAVRPWLLTIARNTVRDYRRKTRRRQLSLASFEDLQTEAPSPEDRLLWEEQVRRTLEALAELGPKDREIISLRYGSALTTRDVASVLGLRETAVTTRLSRALKRLRRKMET